MTVRVLLADKTGLVLAETAARVTAVSERLNKYGRADLVISRNDLTAVADNLQFGGRVLIQFDNGLPDWGGVFELPRKWGDGDIALTAYSGAYLLALRRTGKGRYFTNATVGEIFAAVINEANAVAGMGIAVGDVWGGGDIHSPDYHLDSLYDIITKSVCGRLSEADFAVEPTLVSGRLSFVAHLYERHGADKLNIAMLEGHNVQVNNFNEQGPLHNEITLAGADVTGTGSTGWGDGRLIAQAADLASINSYGLRQYSEVHGGVTSQVTLDGSAEIILDERAQPHELFDLAAIDLAPAAFADYGVGDSVVAWLHSYGFGGTVSRVKVLGRSFLPEQGVAALVVREVSDG
ncbi:hypothetical protein DRO03_07230 [Methanosarcinales archaeon]|nr:MAG: hypothetical protein DRO03_07230 [Methanosarcinales archaeon]